MDAFQAEMTQLVGGLMDLLVDVASIVDDERPQQQQQPSEQEVDKEPLSQLQQQEHFLPEHDYFGAPGTVVVTLRSRIKELRHGDDVEYQRQLGENSIRMPTIRYFKSSCRVRPSPSK
eukprot:scaffold28681_cov48-Attheya_sp.AAC.1